MIKNSNQKWEVGQLVKVGFMKDLKVIAIIPTPGDYAPDQYMLESESGNIYTFTPHKGIELTANLTKKMGSKLIKI